MNQSVNFYELKTQLADLGFKSPELVDDLRNMVHTGQELDTLYCKDEGVSVGLDYRLAPDNNYRLSSVDAWMGTRVQRFFEPGVSFPAIRELLQLLVTTKQHQENFTPLDQRATQQMIYELKTNLMNQNNLDYLKDNLKYLGFEDKLNNDLESKIKEQPETFTLQTTIDHYNNKTEHTLLFRKSDQTDMYFLNRHQATLKGEKPENDRTQTFYLNNGHGITAKEAFNLLEGRAVYKELQRKDESTYYAWSQLDLKGEKNEHGNYQINQFTSAYGYDLEKTLGRFDIKELNDGQSKDNLIRSLERGNVQQVTSEQGKFYIAANPQYKTVNVFDSQHKAVKREVLQKADQSKKSDQSESQKESQRRSRSQKV